MSFVWTARIVFLLYANKCDASEGDSLDYTESFRTIYYTRFFLKEGQCRKNNLIDPLHLNYTQIIIDLLYSIEFIKNILIFFLKKFIKKTLYNFCYNHIIIEFLKF